ncbi:MAG TPA: hypothetical protein VMW48_10280 [Vicinamibacterales bacterium]|nr:hypothetical protein [Vicinamibacterales bacterium]
MSKKRDAIANLPELPLEPFELGGTPWTGFVVETESCVDGVPNRWELTVSGIPEIDLVWYGQWLDQPSVPNLIVIKNDLFMVNHTTSCCAGHKWCPTTGSCIPNRVNCQGTTPA